MLSARAEALHLVRSGEEVIASEWPDGWDVHAYTPEAAAFLNETKPRYYAALAQTIGQVLGHMLSERSNRPPDGLLKAVCFDQWERQALDRKPWKNVAEDMRETFRVAHRHVREISPLYHKAARHTSLESMLALPLPLNDNLPDLLEGGLNTAMGSTFTLLRNLPNVARHHGLDSTNEELRSIARHPETMRVLWPLAKTSSARMRCAQAALVGETGRILWDNLESVLDPEEYQFKHHNDGSLSLAYVDFSALQVKADYSDPLRVRPIAKTTLVSDIESPRGRIVGCPITLLQGRLAELLHWSVDLVESRELWNETWPNTV